jgi:hypothetical protein
MQPVALLASAGNQQPFIGRGRRPQCSACFGALVRFRRYRGPRTLLFERRVIGIGLYVGWQGLAALHAGGAI